MVDVFVTSGDWLVEMLLEVVKFLAQLGSYCVWCRVDLVVTMIHQNVV